MMNWDEAFAMVSEGLPREILQNVRDTIEKRKEQQLKIAEYQSLLTGAIHSIVELLLPDFDLKNMSSYDSYSLVFTLCGRRCLKCGTTDRIETDRIFPGALGGKYTVENIQPLCRHCNRSKQTKIIDYRPPDVAEAVRRYAIVQAALFDEYQEWITETW